MTVLKPNTSVLLVLVYSTINLTESCCVACSKTHKLSCTVDPLDFLNKDAEVLSFMKNESIRQSICRILSVPDKKRPAELNAELRSNLDLKNFSDYLLKK